MKTKIALLVITFFTLTGCIKEMTINSRMDEAEELLALYPGKSLQILDSIPEPETLSEKNFVRWCILYSSASTKLNTTGVEVPQLVRAKKWIDKKGTLKEKAAIRLFLGIKSVKNYERERGLNLYLEALTLAEKAKAYNIVGYIASYTGDLFELNKEYDDALDKYRMAADNFQMYGNTRSYTLALRDMARQYVKLDSVSLALDCLLFADSISITLNNNIVRGSILNGIGNVYKILGDFEKAEEYLLLSLEYDTLEVVPSYLALTNLQLEKKDLLKARNYLEKANRPTGNVQAPAYVHYYHHLINKEEGDYKEALKNFVTYHNEIDSILIRQTELYIPEIERKYNITQIKGQMELLKVKHQRSFTIFLIIVLLLITVGLILRIEQLKAKKKIVEKQEALNRQTVDFLSLKSEFAKKSQNLKMKQQEFSEQEKAIDELYQRLSSVRKITLLSSAIGKKIDNLSKKVVPNTSNKPLLTEKQWIMIREEVEKIYPDFINKLLDLCNDLNENDLRYCCLLLFDLDGNLEGRLLNINPESVHKKRTRIRQKLGINLQGKESLYTYFTENLLRY